jgi:hypothetical protein
VRARELVGYQGLEFFRESALVLVQLLPSSSELPIARRNRSRLLAQFPLALDQPSEGGAAFPEALNLVLQRGELGCQRSRLLLRSGPAHPWIPSGVLTIPATRLHRVEKPVHTRGQAVAADLFRPLREHDKKRSQIALGQPEHQHADLAADRRPPAATAVRPAPGDEPCASTAKPPAVQLPNSVVATPEYRAFLGLNDPTTAQAACVGRRQQRADDLVSRAGSFVGVTSKVSIPSENSFGVHSNNLLWPGNDLYALLAKSDWPSRLRPGNVYANATAPYEGALRAAIVGSEGNLQPADVLYYALKVTNGSYPLAVLTAHNLLKQVAFEGRDAIDTKAGPKLLPKVIAELQAATAVVAKLGSLRCTPAKSRDKIGPWYHEFAVLSAGALVSPGTAGLVVFGEHLGKAAKTALTKVRNTLPAVLKKELDEHGPADFFKGEGGFDAEKYALDNVAADAAETFTISKLSR